ncbi:hypothetical protein B566_EDAN006211 [Ephemera danica]|nr:hypothetical protein B566_EDAN006211 [Ephemera danica]
MQAFKTFNDDEITTITSFSLMSCVALFDDSRASRSPVWKPRDTVGEAATLPRKGKSSTTTVTSATINSAPGDSRSLKKFTDYGGSSLSFANPSASSSNASSSGGSGKRRDT